MNGDAVIRIAGLRKSLGKKVVLQGIDLEVPSGQVIGYIGPNGAGKSTTVRILVGMDNRFDGEVQVAGFSLKEQSYEVKKRVGYVPEQTELYEVLTPREFLMLLGRLHRMPDEQTLERAERLLRFFGLGDQLDNRMDTFSKGMRQKVMIVSGLLHDPQILFLDEPLGGLDANAVIQVKEMLSELARQGKTIFYCSHLMDVVEKVSDRIVLIDQGKIIADGSFEDLKAGQEVSLEKWFANLTGGHSETGSDSFGSLFPSS
jgi:ABC-2 type transport system ATP-binding protein